MKIERPLWYLWFGITGGHYEDADDWFDKNVEPINKILGEGIEVYGNGAIWTKDGEDDFKKLNQIAYKGLVIKVQEINNETAEDVLKDWLKQPEYPGSNLEVQRIMDRARKVLGVE